MLQNLFLLEEGHKSLIIRDLAHAAAEVLQHGFGEKKL
jgi:hypothetical protein